VGKGGRCVRLTTLPPSCAVAMKSGNLNFLEPSGPLQACNGTALPFYLFINIRTCNVLTLYLCMRFSVQLGMWTGLNICVRCKWPFLAFLYITAEYHTPRWRLYIPYITRPEMNPKFHTKNFVYLHLINTQIIFTEQWPYS
jgi:hypothetical protein